MCSFNELLRRYAQQYDNGSFIYKKGDEIKKVQCPNKYGVYVIYGINNGSEEIIYIGAAGTVTQDGKFKNQGIKDRISNTRKKQSADNYYQGEGMLGDNTYSHLEFRWFVTLDDNSGNNNKLPKFAEAELIQCYYNENGCLPKENSSF